MGACFSARVLDAKTIEAARTEFAALQQALRSEYGTNPYNGTLSNCELVGVYSGTPFDNQNAAREWLVEHTEKRSAKIVPFLDGDAARFMVGGWCPE